MLLLQRKNNCTWQVRIEGTNIARFVIDDFEAVAVASSILHDFGLVAEDLINLHKKLKANMQYHGPSVQLAQITISPILQKTALQITDPPETGKKSDR